MKSYFRIVLLLLIIFFTFVSCRSNVVSRKYHALGTIVEIKFAQEFDGRIAQKIINEIEKYENLLSYYRDGSVVSLINKDAAQKEVKIPSEVFNLIRYSFKISKLTDGKFDTTFPPLAKLWRRCARENRLPTDFEIKKAKKLVNWKNIILDPKKSSIRFRQKGMEIDLGGIAKGFIIQKLDKLLEELEVENILVSLGGDVLVRGVGCDGQEWTIGIRDPFNKDKIIKKLKVSNKVVLTSGDYERFVEIKGKKYHHIINPKTGYPVKDIVSVTLVLDDIQNQYLPSIAVFLLGKEEGMGLIEKNPKIDGMIITRDEYIGLNKKSNNRHP